MYNYHFKVKNISYYNKQVGRCQFHIEMCNSITMLVCSRIQKKLLGLWTKANSKHGYKYTCVCVCVCVCAWACMLVRACMSVWVHLRAIILVHAQNIGVCACN